MRQRLQGAILGAVVGSVLTILTLVAVVTVAAATTRSVSITYGVNVVVNGVRQIFSSDMQPFTSEGRTFLPVRGIADALGLDVRFEAGTQTIYLNSMQSNQHRTQSATQNNKQHSEISRKLIGIWGIVDEDVLYGRRIPKPTLDIRSDGTGITFINNPARDFSWQVNTERYVIVIQNSMLNMYKIVNITEYILTLGREYEYWDLIRLR